MKKITRMMVVGVVACLMACATSEEARMARKQQEALVAQHVEQALADRHYVIEVDRAYPQGRMAMRDLSTGYGLMVKGDSVFSRLPFFGRAYSVPYGGGMGLTFKAPIIAYSEQVKKKGEHLIQFETKNPEDYYVFVVRAYTNGSVTVSVTPRQRSNMQYSGKVMPPEESDYSF